MSINQKKQAANHLTACLFYIQFPICSLFDIFIDMEHHRYLDILNSYVKLHSKKPYVAKIEIIKFDNSVSRIRVTWFRKDKIFGTLCLSDETDSYDIERAAKEMLEHFAYCAISDKFIFSSIEELEVMLALSGGNL